MGSTLLTVRAGGIPLSWLGGRRSALPLRRVTVADTRGQRLGGSGESRPATVSHISLHPTHCVRSAVTNPWHRRPPVVTTSHCDPSPGGVVEPTPKFHKVTPHSHCIRQCGTLLTVRVGGVALRSRPSRFPLLPGAVLSCCTSPVTLRRRSADRAQQSMACEPTQPSHVRGYTGDRAWNCRG